MEGSNQKNLTFLLSFWGKFISLLLVYSIVFKFILILLRKLPKTPLETFRFDPIVIISCLKVFNNCRHLFFFVPFLSPLASLWIFKLFLFYFSYNLHCRISWLLSVFKNKSNSWFFLFYFGFLFSVSKYVQFCKWPLRYSNCWLLMLMVSAGF